MAPVPDWLTREDVSRALFLVLGAFIAAFKDAFVWVGRLLTRWVRDRHQSRKSVTIVQDWVRPGAESLWHVVTMNGRNSMHFVGSFRVTNTSDKPLSFTRVECTPSGRARVVHVRVLALSGVEAHRPYEIPPQSIDDVRIEFGLDPAPDWTGERRLMLQLTDSTGVKRKVKATFRALADASR